VFLEGFKTGYLMMYITISAPATYPRDNESAILNLSLHSLDSTMYSAKGKARNGPKKAKIIIPVVFASATNLI